jgi:alkylation response protein AidB-like acyl-CoA dehydrogenase
MIDFSLDETQRHLINTARDFGKEVLKPAELELDKMLDQHEIFKTDLFWDVMKQAFGLGFHKMGLMEMHGGLGLDPNTIGMVWEELSRWGLGFTASLMAGSVVPQMIAIFAGNKKELIDKFVRPFCEEDDPKKISAWGSSEPNVGSDGKRYYDNSVRHASSAVKKGDKWILSGTKSNFVSNAAIADSYIVFCCIDPSMGLRGSGAFLLPANLPGVEKSKTLQKVGMRTLNQAPIFFDEVEVPDEYLIFPHGEGYPMLHKSIITVGNLGTGYLAVGLMRAALEEAMEYAKERVQGGKPIIEHQMVSRKLHDTFTSIETARALLWKGSYLCRTKFPGDTKISLTAKIYATNMAARHTAEMVQVLGGYGISQDYPLEKYMRDAPLLQVMDGTNDTLSMHAAKMLAEE